MTGRDLPTGNPVFDFRAAFRRRAQIVQAVLWYAGWLALAVALCARLFVIQISALYIALSGLLLLVAWAVWGYGWRDRLRADFEKRFSCSADPEGPKTVAGG